jgi:hypothetical protein
VLNGRDCLVTLLRDIALAPSAGALTANVIGHPTGRHLDQPATRIVGHALTWPLRRRGDECFLHSILSRCEVTELPYHRAQYLRREITEQLFGRWGYGHLDDH